MPRLKCPMCRSRLVLETAHLGLGLATKRLGLSLGRKRLGR